MRRKVLIADKVQRAAFGELDIKCGSIACDPTASPRAIAELKVIGNFAFYFLWEILEL